MCIRDRYQRRVHGDWNKKEDFKPRVIPKSEEVKARIRDKTKSSFIFMALNAHELEVVVDAMEEKIFKANDVVIQQGDEGDNLYVIETGNLDCSRVFAKGEAPRFFKGVPSWGSLRRVGTSVQCPSCSHNSFQGRQHFVEFGQGYLLEYSKRRCYKKTRKIRGIFEKRKNIQYY
eukprot:TRINITY_DN9913_c0_g1_i1.p3 TRINITY_DN9913_c0_g1~~TRINITY_DN9913_c0_g1_i1.p3  ORF type:complete len:174 (+),score=19.06 TRINITY_DN9913_c0_g1_i1:170-691(+)